MRNYPSSRSLKAFTIIELLVVVSIIALLVGILLPAIGKAREQAQLTRSQANVTQLGKAAVTYAAEYADRQITFCNDNLSKYGATGPAAITNYFTQVGYAHPPVILGYGQGGIWGYWMYGNPVGSAGNWEVAVPLAFATKFGSFRLPNARQFATYLNGRFYDSSFYAPKDTAVFAAVEEAFDQPDEYTNLPGQVRWSSYCFSPAGMFSPDVLGKNASNKFYTDPFTIQSGHRSPSMSQARYGTLKTHIMEHNWNQNRKKICNPAFNPGTYLGCEPYYFNASYDSTPVTLFYDGHVGSVGCRDAMGDCLRATKQSGNANQGLWSKDTPMGGVYTDYGNDGYYSTQGVDWTSTSFHILTIDGIMGRDILPH